MCDAVNPHDESRSVWQRSGYLVVVKQNNHISFVLAHGCKQQLVYIRKALMLLTSSDLVPLDLVPLQMFRPVALVMAFREVTLEQLLARVSPAMPLQIAASFERLVATRGVALERLLARVRQAVLFQVIASFERLVATRDIALERLLTSVSAHESIVSIFWREPEAVYDFTTFIAATFFV